MGAAGKGSGKGDTRAPFPYKFLARLADDENGRQMRRHSFEVLQQET
jgi:hypothetical protein